ncbi:MAG: ATP-binding protein [Pseudomonadales bacterium]|jgi:PAS domain S-box-containing protein|nr:ATP-binding protein [Pseudomonadales bacterium]
MDDTLFRIFMDHCPLPAFIKTRELRYVWANRRMLELVGRGADEFIGASVFDIFPDSARTLAERERAVLETGEAAIEMVDLCLPDGRIRAFQDIKFRLPGKQGEPLLGVFRIDVTDRVKRQQELEQAERLSALGRLAAGIAHDYRNSLQTILLNAELLKNEADPASIQENVDAIMGAANSSATLTRSLLEFVREAPSDGISTDVNGIIDARLETLGRTLGDRVSIHFTPAADLPELLFEPVHLDQILTNLAINARDAMDGSGNLEVSTHLVPARALERWVTVQEHLRRPGVDHIAILLRDDGAGMTEDIRRHAFEPFYTTKGRDSGTGLGLSTVYGLVKQYDGVIELRSEPGAGTEVRILLPIATD